MKEIFCPITMFALKQKIYSVDTEKEEVATELEEIETDFLPWALLDLCKQNDINKIHLAGDAVYIEDIVENIKDYSEKNAINYAELKDIEIEVN